MVTHWLGCKHCHKVTVACGFQRVTSWECLYKHVEKGLLLDVYVDDFKLGGRKENIKSMWDTLRRHLELDPPANLRDND